MVVYILVGEGGKVEGYGSTRSSDTDVEIDVPEGHPFLLSPTRYKVINNELVSLSQEELDKLANQPKPMTAEERIADLESMVLQLLMGM